MQDNAVTIGENMQVIDAFVQSGTAYVYTHPGDKVASAVFYTGDEAKAKAVALQVAAMQPQYLCVDDVPAEDIQRMQEIYTEEMKDSGKPADILEKIIAGKIQKQWSELVLLEQTSIVDDSKKMSELLGSDTQIHSYVRYAI